VLPVPVDGASFNRSKEAVETTLPTSLNVYSLWAKIVSFATVPAWLWIVPEVL